MVRDIRPGKDYSSDPYELTEVAGDLFFIAYDDTHESALWTSDGTEAGTLLVEDIAPFGLTFRSTASCSSRATTVNRTGAELWRSDGTSGGTFLVSDIDTGAGGSAPSGDHRPGR